MMDFWIGIFWISVLGLLIPYFFYPTLVLFLARFKKEAKGLQSPVDLPLISIVFAAYNEELVLDAKLQSIVEGDYPLDKLEILVGSDNSTDRTNKILEKWQKNYPAIKATFFKKRQGKSAIINQLVQKAQGQFLLLTDANILFSANLLPTLLKKQASVENAAAVGATIHYLERSDKGISKQEKSYLQLENRIKAAESKLWNLVLGLEGGAYLIKRELFPIIPPNYYMEDFFVSLSLLKDKYAILWEPKAIVWEEVSVNPQEEYRRKVRISIGNFQNLKHFRDQIWKKPFPLGLAFLGHKVLRWWTPFFLLLILISAPQLLLVHWFYGLAAGLYMSFIGLGLFGMLFSQHQSAGWLKYPGHFIFMNLALLEGFVSYLKGIESNVWQPTARKQD